MSVGRAGHLVNTKWLHTQLARLPRNMRILDSSWTALKSGYEPYLSKHIPSAQFFDLNQCVNATPHEPRKPPEPACFEKYARSLGLHPDSQLVVYDRGGMLAAARTWWTFRAFGHENITVLDGGIKKWEHDGFQTESGPFELTEPGTFKVAENASLLSKFKDVMRHSRQGTSQLLDARRPEHFYGREEEPTNFTKNALSGMSQPVPSTLHRGHLPRSVNLLEDLVLTEDEVKTLKNQEDLLQLFSSLGIDLTQPLITMCYNGHAACLLALAAAICGKTDTAIYSGSWTETGQRADAGFIVPGPVVPDGPVKGG